jgi:hypothetical protein
MIKSVSYLKTKATSSRVNAIKQILIIINNY